MTHLLCQLMIGNLKCWQINSNDNIFIVADYHANGNKYIKLRCFNI